MSPTDVELEARDVLGEADKGWVLATTALLLALCAVFWDSTEWADFFLDRLGENEGGGGFKDKVSWGLARGYGSRVEVVLLRFLVE